MKRNGSSYRNQKWILLRKRIFERDNFKCCRCEMGPKEVTLQVHHLEYLPGKKLWEYQDDSLITLCKSCHAEEHGLIPPKSGWIYCGENDLEDLIGECEYCGSSLRYEHYISHPKWGEMIVGSSCADSLTGTTFASETEKKRKIIFSRFKTFRDSPRWKKIKNRYFRNYENFKIFIWDNTTHHKASIGFWYKNKLGIIKYEFVSNGVKYTSLDEAKHAVFESIRMGRFQRYVKKNFGHLFHEDFRF